MSIGLPRLALFLSAICFGCNSDQPQIEAHLSMTSKSLAHEVIEEMDKAQDSMDIAIYSLTHEEIAEAISNAHKRGARVRVLIDKAQAGNKSAKDETLAEQGVRVSRDTMSGLMHNKFAVIDGRVVVTGSFNWTGNAEGNNAENLVVIESKTIVDQFQEEFDILWEKNRVGIIKPNERK